MDVAHVDHAPEVVHRVRKRALQLKIFKLPTQQRLEKTPSEKAHDERTDGPRKCVSGVRDGVEIGYREASKQYI